MELPAAALWCLQHPPLPSHCRSIHNVRASAAARNCNAAALETFATHVLPLELSLEDGFSALRSFIGSFHPPPFESGILRFQVPLPSSVKALEWIKCQTLFPQIYISTRHSDQTPDDTPVRVAGVGSTVLFRGTEPFARQHWRSIKRYLSENSPLVRAYGAMRFDPYANSSAEWEPFGTFYFFIPRLELCETKGCSFLAANLTWGDVTFGEAAEALLKSLDCVAAVHVASSFEGFRVDGMHKRHTPEQSSWHVLIGKLLDVLQRGDSGLQKVVMARRTELQIDGDVHPLSLLTSMEGQNPSAYQFYLRLPDGSTFFGNTPEQLFAKDGVRVTSEAVAATRPRGITGRDDYYLGLDLLESSKDQVEFQTVEDHVNNAMKNVCDQVEIVKQKAILKQPRIQHLCSGFSGQLRHGFEEYDMLASLHPTPAVCGYPRNFARDFIASSEAFDRGMYAGPIGWFGGQGAEFAVGIRSSLTFMNETSGTRMFLYAGVGIVKESDSSREWQELDLKISQFDTLLQQSKDLSQVPNINALWADIMVEECSRLGVTHFCIAPGSRSSPLAEAAAANPRVSCVSCLDERSLAYYAVGYGRGSRRPAAVVVTSGTAVSNLLPAVVEASQDCVPLLVLSADRPHELRDTGANQTINQIEHFGRYVRYHFDLPAATDQLPVRMVLTALDTAIYLATRSPCGPVHINCPFREPLESVPRSWDPQCLEGLSNWMGKCSPFTTYINGNAPKGSATKMRAVTSVLSAAERGMIVVGGIINQEQTTWAVYALARHLKWPLVPDVLSGIRLGWCKDVKTIYNFDQVLLKRDLYPAVSPDVILQIGSRITSKRLGHFLATCAPSAHILVDEHPYRHDPAHTITHRVECLATEFARIVLEDLACSTTYGCYGSWLHQLSETVRREVRFHINAESALTEPWIAQAVSSSVKCGNVLFLGNSMPIRDVDMYAEGGDSLVSQDQELPFLIECAANRGASGIDGVLSTAVGFCAGSNKQLTLLLGDVSFLHDSNGLMLLASREGGRPPVTVVVVNNRGGGIFSLLPVASYMPHVAFTKLLSTPHDVNIQKLCLAHGLEHVYVQSKAELANVLESTQKLGSALIIEAGSNIEDNAKFHRYLQSKVCSHLDGAVLKLPVVKRSRVIHEVDVFSYKLRLKATVTTDMQELAREGFVLQITLSDRSVGIGEVAPLQGLHTENLEDVKEQLLFLAEALKNVELASTLELLDGSFSEWLWASLGVQPCAIFPSVRCGLEMAVLQSLASSKECTLWQLLRGPGDLAASINVCGLVDSAKCPEEVATMAERLVTDYGFSSLKIKVARGASPLQDAEVVRVVRRKVGDHVKLRADANGRWTLLEALEFSSAVKSCGLEYLEEPVQASELPEFLRQCDVPVAIDENVDANHTNFIRFLQSLPSSQLVAAIIKPSRVGGFEHAYALARLSHKRKMSAVISACFESSISLGTYAQFAAVIDSKESHGLGTCLWLEDDTVDPGFTTFLKEGSVDAAKLSGASARVSSLKKVERCATNVFTVKVNCGSCEYNFRVIETIAPEPPQEMRTLVFLHGLLGRAEEWLPIMNSLACSFRCLSVELPGHGQSSFTPTRELSMESLGAAVSELLKTLSRTKVGLVGYSLGARLAIYMAARASEHLEVAVSISGSPGIKDEQSRWERNMQDTKLASALRLGGLRRFVSTWYRKPLWKSLWCRPDFEAIKRTRSEHKDVARLADAVECLSVGRQECLWDHLPLLEVPLMLVAGKLDDKFIKIGRDMVAAGHGKVQMLAEVDASGHAVHLECPLQLIRGLRKALNKKQR